MNKLLKTFLLFAFCFLLFDSANAIEHNFGRYNFKLNGYGTLGGLVADNTDIELVKDFSLRGQIGYKLQKNITLGAALSTDYVEYYKRDYVKDAFIFIESAHGRIEFGRSEGVATKLGLGLPDVGGLRINDYPIIYDEINPNGTILSKTVSAGTRNSLHLNAVSAPTKKWQYGASAAIASQSFDYAADIAAKYRKSSGKTKIALSFGASFIDNLKDFNSDIYSARVNADWRASGSVGLNVQYNSWNIGITGRAVYDENPIGIAGDGVSAGAGVSYDLLKFSLSASYIISNTGIFHDGLTFINQSAVLSGRYKFNEWFDVWVSGGATETDEIHPFISGGVRAKF